MLNNFLISLGWELDTSQDDSVSGSNYVWKKGLIDVTTMYISKSLFDDQQKLKDIKQTEWQDDFVMVSTELKHQDSSSSVDYNDLPF